METRGVRWSFASEVEEGTCEIGNPIQADNIDLSD